MDTSRLKKFAQFARRSLIEQVQTKLKLVLAEDSLARRESPKAVKELENKKQELGEEQLLEQVAYTWFNRFCALRFMDVNQYNRIMVVSPVAGQFQPEILAEAKAGHLDDSIFNDQAREKINGLLSGSTPSRDGQSEAYRLMVVAVCNDYYRIMPYLFERIEGYTELLMPDDLLSSNSILAYTREAMTPENCETVESIGWLYQFYISEKKDQVFEGLKKNKKITPENIPAATQLFTPHWIVRYLVENSLGRLWMLNNPSSKVIEQMDYYIKPIEEEKDYLKISSPEELKICDPACGSGHMLTYAYDLLYAIYLDAGYDSSEIPEKILTNNLFGIEIDERAAELAAFALSMKALKGNPLDESNNRRHFFRNPTEPNICHIENVSFIETELKEYFEFVGTDLLTKDLRLTLKEFEEADNFGSLIQPSLKNPADVLMELDAKDVSGQLFLADTHKSVLKVLKQVDYLSQKYHVVVANPPYLTSSSMNSRLSKWLGEWYSLSKADLFSAFIERNSKLAKESGYTSMITMQSWMFLPSFEKFRVNLLYKSTLLNLSHIGTGGFDSIGGQVVSTSAFVICNNNSDVKGDFIRLTGVKGEKNQSKAFLNSINEDVSDIRFSVGREDFAKVPGMPVAYWISDALRSTFDNTKSYDDLFKIKAGISTGKNEKFILTWPEVSASEIKSFGKEEYKYTLHNKGGEYRKWYGNIEHVLKYSNNHISEMEENPGFRHDGKEYYFHKHIGWTKITSFKSSFRYYPEDFTFDSAGLSIFSSSEDSLKSAIGFLNSSVSNELIQMLNPTLNVTPQILKKLPYIEANNYGNAIQEDLISLAKMDWDLQEVSIDFRTSPLLSLYDDKSKLSEMYKDLKKNWEQKVESCLEFEIQNNKHYMNLYGLTNELDKEFPIEEISLNINPAFRYKNIKITGTDVFENLLLKDTIKDFISYSVGCIFGRYSIDKNGLILANQDVTLDEYCAEIPQPSFDPDKDNVVPLIDFEGDWFEDDIAERFKQFLKVTFGEEHFYENLKFIEEAIGKDIKKHFVKDFYTDHVKRYKKRPIYWMFSSPKGSFNALIYMHRYNKDTVDVVLNNYLREFRTKLLARKESLEQIEISASANQKDKTQAIKAMAKINKVLEEINDYEHDELYPLASEKVEIDLDDGVKHNYPLFGKALKKVPGLS
jgi:hypothetical protein